MDGNAHRTFEPGDQEQGDLLLLAALKRDGFDLSRSADVACFIELPELDAARAAARALRSDGWDAQVHVTSDGSGWSVEAERRMVPSWRNVSGMGETMNELAAQLGGAYDGWGVKVQ